ncbi:TRAP transporter small permease [Microvirga soli]|uniref:TRAP transporter small permease n=1 Tax=Microvirga soli TaxID=1854496 RepID=UPI00191CEC3C|nr:TRAP transporter small permease subunit [Microvirga soli]
MFVTMFAAFLLQVFTRYILNDPVAWTQEFVLIAYIWIVFWCAAFLLREREHITFDMFYLALPLAGRRVLAIVLTALTGIAFIVALPATVDFVTFMKIEKSPVIGLRFDFLYAIFVVFVIAVAISAVVRVWRLLSRSWQDELRTNGDFEP